ncbi:ABC transporter substrate-binding protein [Roseivivax sediminis]|uniref:NitT/TauT family transport system substrate-binding protein n=1 Tax=Roseivivax sediminis TaxID=936889 RepID=A0A1I1VA76_9RHOB|nr:ABC transporter substrate-binding protein [Roseivivax sediminis]SFD78868.1 NitT/TauT family transport system substrate-binding protein [Roseivivax sediminis]
MTMERRSFMRAAAGALTTTVALSGAPALAQDEPLQVALGDIASVESLNLLIAMERAGERGVPMEMTFFNSEDVAVQAVLSGEVDIGVGAPYAFIQNSDAPIRMFYRMSTLMFFPVVNSDVYSGWEDLDGEEVTVHSRGSGTEALMRLMEQKHGIEYSQISYVPGSEVRAGAMLQGTVNATIVDAANFRLLQQEGGDKFQRLPLEGVNATDEALYATTDVMEARAEDMQIFVEELLGTWADIAENPEIVGELRAEYGLLQDLPDNVASEAVPYYAEAVENGVYPTDGGEPSDVADDIAFLAAAGQVSGDPEEIDPERFWNFDLLEAAKAAN